MYFAQLAAILALACAPPQQPAARQVDDSSGAAAPDASTPKRDAVAVPSAFPAAPGMLGLLSSVLDAAHRPGPWEAPTESPGAASGPASILVQLGGAIVEQTVGGFGDPGGASLRDLTDAFLDLDGDPAVTNLLLRVDTLDISLPAAEELRGVIASLRKPVHCHAESAEGPTYYLLTACDSLTLAPTGEVVVSGPHVSLVYLGGLLDRLAVRADFLYVGRFKGAAEPLTRTSPSAEMQATMQAVVAGAHLRLVQGMAKGRGKDPSVTRAWIDRALFSDTDAKDQGLIDAIADFSAWRDGHAPWREETIGADDPMGSLLSGGLFAGPPSRPTEPHLALLYAVGEVVDGDGIGGAIGARSEIAARPFAAAVRAAGAADAVKAIVIRVDSPGGSALASDVIWHAVRDVAARKPVIVSMGEMAASGGYYISAPATRIWAQPDTLTGSIGVVGGKIVVGAALAKLGVSVHEISMGARAGLWSVGRTFDKSERAAVQAHMQSVYEVFKQRVAAGRKLSPEVVERVAQGRLWIGSDAVGLGLVDSLGGLEDAILQALQMGGLPDDALVDTYPPAPTVFDVLDSLLGWPGFAVRARATAEWVGPWGAMVPGAERAVASSFALLRGFAQDRVRVIAILPLLSR